MYYLYRCFDGAGALLYVGSTHDVSLRCRSHSLKTPWFDMVFSVTSVAFASRPEALFAEREAINTERPLFNIKRLKQASTKNIGHADVVRLIKICGGTITGVAARLDVKEQTVKNWKANGIPLFQQRRIEALTDGKLKAAKP